NYADYVSGDASGLRTFQSAAEDLRMDALLVHDQLFFGHQSDPLTTFDMLSGVVSAGRESRYPYPTTQTWRLALGGYHCWIEAHVIVRVPPAPVQNQRRFFAIQAILHVQ